MHKLLMAFFGHRPKMGDYSQQRSTVPAYHLLFHQSFIFLFFFRSPLYSRSHSCISSFAPFERRSTKIVGARVRVTVCVWNSVRFVVCVYQILCWYCSKTLILYVTVSFHRTHNIEMETRSRRGGCHGIIPTVARIL